MGFRNFNLTCTCVKGFTYKSRSSGVDTDRENSIPSLWGNPTEGMMSI